MFCTFIWWSKTIAFFTSQSRDHKRFAISEVAAAWHELVWKYCNDSLWQQLLHKAISYMYDRIRSYTNRLSLSSSSSSSSSSVFNKTDWQNATIHSIQKDIKSDKCHWIELYRNGYYCIVTTRWKVLTNKCLWTTFYLCNFYYQSWQIMWKNDSVVGCVRLCPCAACADNTFQCQSNGMCIPSCQLCDGYTQCGDYSDEYNCTGINSKYWHANQVL